MTSIAAFPAAAIPQLKEEGYEIDTFTQSILGMIIDRHIARRDQQREFERLIVKEEGKKRNIKRKSHAR